MKKSADIDAYFERVAFAGSIAPSVETLTLLVQQHLATIPFETLDALLGVPVRLDLSDLQQKLLFDRRGGNALEHNLLIAAMLRELDFPVKLFPATLPGADEPAHLLLSVEADGVAHLVDPGLGADAPTAPLRFRPDVDQMTPHGGYRLVGDTRRTLLRLDGEAAVPLYEFVREEIGPSDVATIASRVADDAKARDVLRAARSPKGRRLSLRNAAFTAAEIGGETVTRRIGTAVELRDILTREFTIPLPAGERLDPALERLVVRENGTAA